VNDPQQQISIYNLSAVAGHGRYLVNPWRNLWRLRLLSLEYVKKSHDCISSSSHYAVCVRRPGAGFLPYLLIVFVQLATIQS
jgi:hypothetical protein